MVMKIIRHLWGLRNEFVKYFTIGIGAFLADIGSLYALKEWAGLSATAAVVLYLPPLTFGVFYLNKKWSFGAAGITHRQAIRFYILSVINYFISIAWIIGFHDKLGIQYLLARTANIALSVAWNFLVYKYWVYRA